MRKLVIICFYELKDYLLTLEDMFIKKYNWKVISYPLYMYCYDKNSKIENYSDHLSSFMAKEAPDIVFWWFTDVPVSVFLRIKQENTSTYFINYNYSDPVNLNRSYLEKCNIFDHIITVCKTNLPIYKIHSKNKYIDFRPFGFDKNMFRRYTNSEMDGFNRNLSCDISLICDSLYMDQPDQIISRKTVISTIEDFCRINNLKFHLYGPDFLVHYVKNQSVYKGDINYLDSPAVALLSKINIITHPNSTKLGFCNTHLFQTLACGGIVLMDNIRGSEMFFNSDKKVLFLYNPKDLIDKIKTILNMYNNEINEIDKIREQAIEFTKPYNWDSFVENIFMRYNYDRFDHEFYDRVYRISSNDKTKEPMVDTEIDLAYRDKMYKNWLSAIHKGDMRIPYKIVVPENFDCDNYRLKFNLPDDLHDNEYVYIHWYNSGQNMDYIKRSSNKNASFSGATHNLCTTKMFDAFSAFNSIYVYRDIDKGLENLFKISKQNPRLKINDILKSYIDISVSE